MYKVCTLNDLVYMLKNTFPIQGSMRKFIYFVRLRRSFSGFYLKFVIH